jgi:hypothetical protein
MSDEPATPRQSFPSDDIIEDAFLPYIRTIGSVVNAWNHLQEQMNKLFIAVTGMSSEVATAIWHSARSDSLQRDFLAAAVRATPDDKWLSRSSSAKSDLILLINCANKLSEIRNDAVHAPVSLAIDNAKLVIIPTYFSGNPRAVRLKGKDIVKEFEDLTDKAQILKQFASDAETAIIFESYPWPEKPALLIPPQKKSRVTHAPQFPIE